jgi:DTW domain-containing protein YfiP
MHRSLCICGLLPRLSTRTRVVFVIHQLEANKPTNTGAVASRCLENSAVVYRGRAPERAEATEPAWTAPPGVQAAVLFPGPEATPLEDRRWRDRETLLVVPDGTWSQAARTRRRLPGLAALPCVSIEPRPGGDVERLRTPPRPGRMATLEAVALALGVLEGPAVGEALMRVYRIMTERTLWTNGRIRTEQVTGGIPDGVRSHAPLGSRG